MADQDWKESYKKQLAKKNTKSSGSSGARAGSGYWRRIIVGAWAAATAVQIVMWLVISLISGRFTEPWWLWTAASGGIVAIAVWFVLVKPRYAGKEGER